MSFYLQIILIVFSVNVLSSQSQAGLHSSFDSFKHFTHRTLTYSRPEERDVGLELEVSHWISDHLIDTMNPLLPRHARRAHFGAFSARFIPALNILSLQFQSEETLWIFTKNPDDASNFILDLLLHQETIFQRTRLLKRILSFQHELQKVLIRNLKEPARVALVQNFINRLPDPEALRLQPLNRLYWSRLWQGYLKTRWDWVDFIHAQPEILRLNEQDLKKFRTSRYTSSIEPQNFETRIVLALLQRDFQKKHISEALQTLSKHGNFALRIKAPAPLVQISDKVHLGIRHFQATLTFTPHVGGTKEIPIVEDSHVIPISFEYNTQHSEYQPLRRTENAASHERWHLLYIEEWKELFLANLQTSLDSILHQIQSGCAQQLRP